MEHLTIRNPADGGEVSRVPVSGPDDLDRAVEAAWRCAPEWSAVAPAERASMLKDGARALRNHVDELAQLQTLEMGKPIGDSRGGVLAGIGAVEQYAELGPLHRGRRLLGSAAATDVMEPVPYGVAACIVPWNDPVAVALGLVSACLVGGNAVVLKPSERAPLAVARAAELLGLPPGVLGVVHGSGPTGQRLVADPRVQLVCHVGSVATGRSIAEVCASQLKKAVLELGGKDPLIIDDDVDPAWAAEQAALGAFANAGQICTSVERIYVHEAVAEPFVDALVSRAIGMRMGDGRDPDTQLGPLVDDRLRQVVHGHVVDAVERGAALRCGGSIPESPGSFYPATVLTGCTQDMVVMRDETFGPVAPVMTVRSFDEAIGLANDSTYGLAATVLTNRADHARRASRELAVGTVKINAVFGGAPGGAAHPHGNSGLGYGYGPELLDEVTRTRVVHHLALGPDGLPLPD
jgi:acyl-CoA reductase-like NAD-dependent aldehyde dehydrogenase